MGVLETIRVRNGRAPLLDRHAARLEAACRALQLPPPREPLARLLASRLGTEDGVVRVTVDSGGTSETSRPVPPIGPIAAIVARTRHTPYPFKVTDRAPFAAAHAEARAAGADDALLLTPAGLVAEGTVWTIFWWDGDRLATPPLALGVLPGVGRARVLELEPTVERACRPRDLVGRSLFATNAVRGVVSISRLDDRSVPEDARTVRLAKGFWPE
ncbi:MAG: aminotransferase class IV [Gemmatimonadales bacterium]